MGLDIVNRYSRKKNYAIKDLLMKLLEKDQNKRYSWDDYFKDPFFDGNNKSDIN